jgi:DNA-binding transcriptional ArsR family regulator
VVTAHPRVDDALAGAVFSALADDTRRAVLTAVAVRGTATATELTGEVAVSRQAVAKHLGVLADAGLVTSERSGREARYRVVPGALRPARDWIAASDAAWSRRLDRLASRVRR